MQSSTSDSLIYNSLKKQNEIAPILSGTLLNVVINVPDGYEIDIKFSYAECKGKTQLKKDV
jgi:hypothetical protein